MSHMSESLLRLTTKRAFVRWGGLDAGYEGGGLSATLTVAKLIPRVGRLAAFICEWAAVMDLEGVDELSPEVFADGPLLSRATTYRRLREYDELWGDVMSINDMGRAILA